MSNKVLPESSKPVQCVWCRKLFNKGGNMACGATVPTQFAHGPNGAWCKTDDIVKMFLEKGPEA